MTFLLSDLVTLSINGLTLKTEKFQNTDAQQNVRFLQKVCKYCSKFRNRQGVTGGPCTKERVTRCLTINKYINK